MLHGVVGVFGRGVVILLLGAAVAHAQATAQINGTIRDTSNAALPGVSVSAVQTETGLTRSAVTDDTGSYILQNLPVGPYRVEAELQGFRKFVQTGVVLQVNANPTLNVTLQLGDMHRLPFASGRIDVVTGSYALRNAPSLTAALEEVHRVLRQIGRAHV